MNTNIKVKLVKKHYEYGNIGVALSGGGSRAMTAAMGQLRGLRYLRDKNGDSLLDKTDYLSTVSGGSWLGCTYTYLTDEFSDDDFLGTIVENPDKLKLSHKNSTYSLNYLHNNNIGKRITKDFNVISMAYELVVMKIKGVDDSILWQNIIGDRILNHYNLYSRNNKYEPTSIFTLDEATYMNIKERNPKIDDYKVHYVKKKRPFLICNSSMFCKKDDESFTYLVPFQTTPLYTGIMGEYSGHGVKSQELTPIGGGYIESFAFNNICLFKNNEYYEFEYERPYSLMDAAGTSSAFYAQLLQEKFQEWNDDIRSFYRDLQYLGKDKAEEVLGKYELSKGEIESYLKNLKQDVKLLFNFTRNNPEDFIEENKTDDAVKINIQFDLIPEYRYWSVYSNKTVGNQYADGGNLENTGINALLSYKNINKILAFVNSGNSIKQNGNGIIMNGNHIDNTNVILDDQIPPLFGFQPYDNGYTPYSEVKVSKNEIYRYNKIFKEEDFIDFLSKLKTNAGESFTEGTAFVNAKYNVLENSWFNIKGDREVEFLIVYLNLSDQWFDQLDDSVKKHISRIDSWSVSDGFPHYSTFDTQLSKIEVNLMAHLTSWHIVNDRNKEIFIDFFEEELCN